VCLFTSMGQYYEGHTWRDIGVGFRPLPTRAGLQCLQVLTATPSPPARPMYEECSLLGCVAAWVYLEPTFRSIGPPPSSEWKDQILRGLSRQRRSSERSVSERDMNCWITSRLADRHVAFLLRCYRAGA
jgi:hypothetical protein